MTNDQGLMTPLDAEMLAMARQIFVGWSLQVSVPVPVTAAYDAIVAAKDFQRAVDFYEAGGRRKEDMVETDFEFRFRIQDWERKRAGPDQLVEAKQARQERACFQCKSPLGVDWPAEYCGKCRPVRSSPIDFTKPYFES